jgi:hypothetical protein
MIDQLALLDLPEAHLRALEFLLNRVPPLEYIWSLTGSAGLRLQGWMSPCMTWISRPTKKPCT